MSVTVVAWIVLVTAGIALIATTKYVDEEFAKRGEYSISLELVLRYLQQLTALVSALGLLMGRSWGRLLFLASGCMGLATDCVAEPYDSRRMLHLLPFLVMAAVLFRPNASAYFRGERFPGDQAVSYGRPGWLVLNALGVLFLCQACMACFISWESRGKLIVMGVFCVLAAATTGLGLILSQPANLRRTVGVVLACAAGLAAMQAQSMLWMLNSAEFARLVPERIARLYENRVFGDHALGWASIALTGFLGYAFIRSASREPTVFE